MELHDKVIYNSITGSVKAVVVEVITRAYGDTSAIDRLKLRSTARGNPSYPTGCEWTVPAGSAALVAR